jgi:hypothetical protein
MTNKKLAKTEARPRRIGSLLCDPFKNLSFRASFIGEESHPAQFAPMLTVALFCRMRFLTKSRSE